jgi:hypothetical protein
VATFKAVAYLLNVFQCLGRNWKRCWKYFLQVLSAHAKNIFKWLQITELKGDFYFREYGKVIGARSGEGC